MNITTGLLIPFLGTTLGSAMVFLMKNRMNEKLEKILLGFASGVMIAASVWSLMIPSIEMAEEQGTIAWFPASAGFLLGILFLLLLDSLIPHLHLGSEEPEGLKSRLQKTTMMVLAVTLHNIPERNGGRSYFCGGFGRKCWHHYGRSFCVGTSGLPSKIFQKEPSFQCH